MKVYVSSTFLFLTRKKNYYCPYDPRTEKYFLNVTTFPAENTSWQEKIMTLQHKEDMSGFAMTYELVHDNKIPYYDKDGISKLTWLHISKVKELWSKDNSKFKNDFIQNFNYWIE